jgi:ribosomal protein S18 acetylase RimI-like enzyme
MLEWDSAFFGFRIAQVVGNTLSDAKARDVIQWSETQALRCLYFLADAKSERTARIAQELGFFLVDVRMELRLDDPFPKACAGSDLDLRPARASDLPALQAVAREAHQDSRFFFDTRFPKARAEELFATWIAKDYAGRAEKVLVVEGRGTGPVGYITCNLINGSGTGRIGLVGVASEFRGKGLGRALLLGALEWFGSIGARRVLVVTQARNVAAQRLYQTAGFLTDSVRVWYHRWF